MSPRELAGTIDIEARPPGAPRWMAFIGPAVLVSVGYMDPGNWATDLEGGARFGYQLLWVLLASNLIALLLQSLSARLGVISGLDLAEACHACYSRRVGLVLWLLAEVAIVACDLAEVLGSAIALNLLFGIPMVWGALLTAVDVFLILLLQQYGVRKLEAIIFILVFTIGACFVAELALIKPAWPAVAAGFVPRLSEASLYIAIGILGATVMPHNLYLHSAIVRTRRTGIGMAAKKQALKWNLIDTTVALNIAFLINAAILIVSATVFFKSGIEVTDLREAHKLLTPLVGTEWAAILFAVALLCAGQSATITGTLAGQVVMEGFLNLRMRAWLRRVITRCLAIVPAVVVLVVVGEEGTLPLLIASQVVLSLQLPFAVIPLIRVTSRPALMHNFASPPWMKLLAWTSAAFITVLNMWLVYRTIAEWQNTIAVGSAVLVAIACVGMLAWITFVPLAAEAEQRVTEGA